MEKPKRPSNLLVRQISNKTHLIGRPARFFWDVLFRNRFAIAVASLIWLVWRSGTQPRRLAYPCQQAAAANLGFLAVLFIPEAARRHAARHGTMRRAVGLATGSIALAGVLFLLVSEGKQLYSDYVTAGVPAGIPAPAVTPPAATVGIKKTTQAVNALSAADIEAMVREAVAKAGGLFGIIQPGQSVAIKPNLVNNNDWQATSPSGVTTDPRVVLAVVKLAKEAGAGAVTIVEGSAGPAVFGTTDPTQTGRNITWLAFQKCKYDANLDHWFDLDTTVALIDLNDAGYTDPNTGQPALVPRPFDPNNPPVMTKVAKVSLGENGVIRKDYFLSKALLKSGAPYYGTADVLITVPTLKNHGQGGMTMALKNYIGIAPSDIYHDSKIGHTNQMKRDLHFSGTGEPFPRNVTHGNPGAPSSENQCVQYTIVDLNLCRPSDFSVVDGLVGIIDGPTGTATIASLYGGGWNNMSAIILAGKDAVATDTVGALCEGYDPLVQSHQLAWAWNRGLGNLDTTAITVLGDHVGFGVAAPVRKDYPLTYNGKTFLSRADITPPTFTGLVPAEGATVSGEVNVTGSGISGDVVKAELSVKMNDGANLLTNGDFETGIDEASSGWTAWTGWGSNIVRTYNYSGIDSDGRLGTKCLKMTCTSGSFGVYKTVDVVPGKTYRMDGFWKGLKQGTNGGDNWYEILLLNGVWDQSKADSNPGSPPYNNETQAVFNEMYGYDNHTYTMPSSFGWLWAHTTNGTKIDTATMFYSNPAIYNPLTARNGLRTATGNKMTVVLKVGALSPATGGTGWFDGLTLAEAGVPEQIVATVAYPSNPFNVIWHATSYPVGSYVLKATVYDAALNEANITRNVTLSASAGQADFTANVTTGVAPLAVQFTDQSTVVGASAWAWNFGDGQTSTLKNPPHTYASAGTYTVGLTVTGSSGPISTQKSNYITVTAPSLYFTADVTTGPVPLAVQFTDQSTVPGATAWHWDFGDGTTSDEHNPTHSYTLEGAFDVTLTVTGTGGPITLAKSGFISVANAPKVAFIGGPIGGTWPNTADTQIMTHLRAMGLVVDAYQDDRALRPAAATIATGHQLVIASSTVTSANIAGDFRNQLVPFIFWEPSLAWHSNPDNRECLANSPGTVASQTQIQVTDITHPIMAGIASGTITVLNSAETLSYCSGTVGSGVKTLATTNNSSQRVVLAADAGAQLLDGQPAAAKRVMLFLYDNTWEKTNATGQKIFDNAVKWTLGSPQAVFSAAYTSGSVPMTARFTDASTGPVTSWTWDFGDGTTSRLRHPTHKYTQQGTYTVKLTVGGIGNQSHTLTRTNYIMVGAACPVDYDLNGVVNLADLDLFRGCAAGAAVVVDVACAGKDMDHDFDVDQDDFAIFQRCWSGDVPAQSNCP